jgi:hypothetical protein
MADGIGRPINDCDPIGRSQAEAVSTTSYRVEAAVTGEGVPRHDPSGRNRFAEHSALRKGQRNWHTRVRAQPRHAHHEGVRRDSAWLVADFPERVVNPSYVLVQDGQRATILESEADRFPDHLGSIGFRVFSQTAYFAGGL